MNIFILILIVLLFVSKLCDLGDLIIQVFFAYLIYIAIANVLAK